MSETSPPRQPSSVSVDLQGDSSLQVEISDAVSERDKVKFTVQTKVRLPGGRDGHSDGCLRSLLPPASLAWGWGAYANIDFGPCSSTWLSLPPASPRKQASCLVSSCLLPPAPHPTHPLSIILMEIMDI